jgi:hypothetical protein
MRKPSTGRRLVGSLVLLGSVAVLFMATLPAANWSVPRTPWGHPDLQGIWTTDEEIGVPFERAKEFGERALMTDAEIAALEERERKRAEAPRRDGSTGAGPEHWYEGGSDPAGHR